MTPSKRKTAIKLLKQWKSEDAAYLAGLKEGARSERRALKRWIDDLEVTRGITYSMVCNWIAARPKVKK